MCGVFKKARKDELRNTLSSLKYCLQGYIHDKPHTYGAVHEQSWDAITAVAFHDQDKNDNAARYGNTDIDQLVHITLRISETEAKDGLKHGCENDELFISSPLCPDFSIFLFAQPDNFGCNLY
jgi:hypothetical protein